MNLRRSATRPSGRSGSTTSAAGNVGQFGDQTIAKGRAARLPRLTPRVSRSAAVVENVAQLRAKASGCPAYPDSPPTKPPWRLREHGRLLIEQLGGGQ
jgi:hypothetical protein